MCQICVCGIRQDLNGEKYQCHGTQANHEITPCSRVVVLHLHPLPCAPFWGPAHDCRTSILRHLESQHTFSCGDRKLEQTDGRGVGRRVARWQGVKSRSGRDITMYAPLLTCMLSQARHSYLRNRNQRHAHGRHACHVWPSCCSISMSQSQQSVWW
jgi:hypothetical protein